MGVIQASVHEKSTEKKINDESGNSKKSKKSYMDFENLFVHKTQSERRKALFGKDPLVMA